METSSINNEEEESAEEQVRDELSKEQIFGM